MSNSINVTRQLLTTAPYTESTNATILKNVVSVQVDGSSSFNQSLNPSSLMEEDFYNTVRAQTQTGTFVSLTDKEYYPIDLFNTEENEIKSIETEFGVAYNYLSDASAETKYPRVLEDVKVKNTVINNPEWGTPAYIAHVQQIEADINQYRQTRNQRLGSSKSVTRISNTNRSYDNSNYGKTPDIPFYVRITEDQKDTYEALSAKGSFGNDPVIINVFQNVVNFSFDTTQTFSEIIPRGAQTPMRYYDKNIPRSLSFTTEFHQQEFPLEPLLTIAEKAQYLARPYRHGDYSLIPKLVRVEIPGRVFRGYVVSAAITYSGEDYRQWTQESVRAGLYGSQGQMASLGGYVQYDIDYNPQSTGIQNGQYNQTQDKMDYGLSKLNIDFRIAIVEEVRLSVYLTAEEQREMEALDQAQEEKEALQLDWEQAIWTVETNLAQYGILEGNNPEALIFVDKITGEFLGYAFTIDEQGNLVYVDPPEGAVTLEQFKKREEIRESNQQNSNADLFYKNSESLLDHVQGDTFKEELINDILTIQAITGKPETPVYDKPSLQLKSLEELRAIRMEQVRSENLSASYLLDFTDMFSVVEEDKEGTKKIVSYLDKFPVLKELIKLPIVNLKDCKVFLDRTGITKTVSAPHFRYLNSNEIGIWNLQTVWDELHNPTIQKDGCIMGTTITNFGLQNFSGGDVEVDVTRVDKLSEQAKAHMISSGMNPFKVSQLSTDPDIEKKLRIPNIGVETFNDELIRFMVSLVQSVQTNLPRSIEDYITRAINSQEGTKFYPTEEVGQSLYRKEGYSQFYYLVLKGF